MTAVALGEHGLSVQAIAAATRSSTNTIQHAAQAGVANCYTSPSDYRGRAASGCRARSDPAAAYLRNAHHRHVLGAREQELPKLRPLTAQGSRRLLDLHPGG